MATTHLLYADAKYNQVSDGTGPFSPSRGLLPKGWYVRTNGEIVAGPLTKIEAQKHPHAKGAHIIPRQRGHLFNNTTNDCICCAVSRYSVGASQPCSKRVLKV